MSRYRLPCYINQVGTRRLSHAVVIYQSSEAVPASVSSSPNWMQFGARAVADGP